MKYTLVTMFVAMALTATNAMASFYSLDCSTSSASVQRVYLRAVNKPTVDKWLYRGQEAKVVGEVKESEKNVLETKSNNIQGREVYTVKMEFSLRLQGGPELMPVNSWFICTRAAGI